MATTTKKKKSSPEAQMRARYKEKYGTNKFGYRKCKQCGKVDVAESYKGLLCRAKCLKAMQHEFYLRRKSSA